MCPFFGLKCLKIDLFWSSFDWLEDILSGITVSYTKSPDHNYLFYGHGDFEKCITAYLINSGQVIHGLHGHAP